MYVQVCIIGESTLLYQIIPCSNIDHILIFPAAMNNSVSSNGVTDGRAEKGKVIRPSAVTVRGEHQHSSHQHSNHHALIPGLIRVRRVVGVTRVAKLPVLPAGQESWSWLIVN